VTSARLWHAVAVLLVALGLTAPVAAGATRAPRPSAKQAIVMETSTGDVAYARRPGQSRPIASVTKLMTALLTLEERKLSDPVTAVRYRASPVESQLGLRAGERLTDRRHAPRPDARVGQRRRGVARRGHRRLRARLRARDEPPGP
jgi:D-alanyl-D-alanine carboxypeptidase